MKIYESNGIMSECRIEADLNGLVKVTEDANVSHRVVVARNERINATEQDRIIGLHLQSTEPE